jgi:hypothetical protein
MRHIDDLRFEIEALKDHATRSSNETLMASACFMADTLNSLERFLTESERKATVEPINKPWAFPVGRSNDT